MASTEPTSSPDGKTLRPWKKALFALITTAGFFVLVELSLAIVGIEPVLYEEDPYVGFASSVPLFAEQNGPDGETYMTTAPGKLAWFNDQRFAKEKPPGTYRIFSLGGSTTYGRPYDDKVSFSGWLRELLPVADPTRKWEVINAGGISYASYRVAAVMEELLEYEPDLFVVYSGHNEFLERRTYQRIIEAPQVVTDIGALLSHTRLYTAAQKLLDGGPEKTGVDRDSRAVLQAEVDEILAHSVGPEDYTRDNEFREQVIAHYRYNLNRMVDIARSAGAEVLFVTLASNLKDVSPFKSEHRHDITAGGRRRFEELSARAKKSRISGVLDEALSALDEAATLDDRYAELHYRRGQVLYESGHYEKAAEAFERALDEDVCPLRAPTAIREIVAEVALRRDVPVVDFVSLIEEGAPHGIPGSEHFLDHVHLTIDGYRLLALELINALEKRGLLDASDSWNEGAISAVAREVEGRIDKRSHGIALRNLAKVFHWAGKVKEAEALAARATGLLGADAESYAMLGRSAAARGDVEEAIRNYRRALDINPNFAEAHYNLGFALMSEQRLAEAIQHYRQALGIRPDYAETHCAMGIAVAQQGGHEEATEHYRQALRIRPDYPEAHYHWGGLLMSERRLEEAIQHYKRAIEFRPEYPQAHNNLGLALMSQGRNAEAVRHFRRSLQVNPDYAAGHYNLGNALMSEKKLDDAVTHFREVLRLAPESAAAHYSLGGVLGLLQKHREAAQHFREALRIDPNHVGARQNLAVALRAQGKHDEAMHVVGKAKRSNSAAQ